MNPLLEAAIQWAMAGVEVIPLARLSNRPHQMLGSGWSRRTVGSTSLAQIQEWWSTDPAANLGLVNDTGGLLIMDIDMKHGVDGMQSVAELEAWSEHELPQAAWVSTPSGGRHVYFRTGLAAGTLALPILGLLPGIDFPWQVACPPSGRELRVADPQTGEVFSAIGEYKSNPADGIPMAPDWLMGVLRSDRTSMGPLLSQERATRQENSLPPLAVWEADGFGIVTGSRNQDAFKLASKLFNQMDGDLEAVRLTMFTIWQKTRQPAGDVFSWYECEKCISQARRYWAGGVARDRELANGIAKRF